jgi:hypothetical protein
MRQVKIVEGTIGSLPCEVSLNTILINCNDSRIIAYCTRRYHSFKFGLKELEALAGSPLYERMVMLWRKDNLKTIEENKDNIPLAAYTHLKCCIAAKYREAMNKYK